MNYMEFMDCLGWDQFETAKWYPERGNRALFREFQFARIDEERKNGTQPIQNLFAPQKKVVIRTAFRYEFEMKQEVTIGMTRYIISNIGYIDMDVNPQVMGLLGYNPNRHIVLELLEME